MDATRLAIFMIPVIGALWSLWLHYQRRHQRRVARSLQTALRQQVAGQQQAAKPAAPRRTVEQQAQAA